MYPPALGFGATWWRADAGGGVWGRVDIGVGDADVTGLALPLQSAVSVTGRLVFDDPVQPPPNERYPIALEPANGDPALGVPNTYTDAHDETHSFWIGGLQAGRYLVRIPFARGWRIASVRAGGVDVTHSGLDATSGATLDDVVVTLSRRGATLSGVAQNADGQSAAAAILVFPTDDQQWVDYGLTPARIRSIRSGPTGAFELAALDDGEYFAIALSTGQAGLWPDPKFLAAAAAQATRVTLTVGSTVTRNLRITEVKFR
jgi:hypothetical protein